MCSGTLHALRGVKRVFRGKSARELLSMCESHALVLSCLYLCLFLFLACKVPHEVTAQRVGPIESCKRPACQHSRLPRFEREKHVVGLRRARLHSANPARSGYRS